MQTDYSNGELVSDGLGIGREVSGELLKRGIGKLVWVMGLFIS